MQEGNDFLEEDDDNDDYYDYDDHLDCGCCACCGCSCWMYDEDGNYTDAYDESEDD